jgi:hypothetical protein
MAYSMWRSVAQNYVISYYMRTMTFIRKNVEGNCDSLVFGTIKISACKYLGIPRNSSISITRILDQI